MAFEDPISITVDAVAQAMPRVASSGFASSYRKVDGTYRLDISHQTNDVKRTRNTTSGVKTVSQKVIRSLTRFVKRAVVADAITAENDYEELRISLIIERPETGFTASDLDKVWTGFKNYLVTAKTDKLFGLES